MSLDPYKFMNFGLKTTLNDVIFHTVFKNFIHILES